ncbi:MAG: hypothetical protein LBL74_02890 [Bacteroidales bacterium]|nr:hypothetical protein [Bacteroidales bacterium]
MGVIRCCYGTSKVHILRILSVFCGCKVKKNFASARSAKIKQPFVRTKQPLHKIKQPFIFTKGCFILAERA